MKKLVMMLTLLMVTNVAVAAGGKTAGSTANDQVPNSSDNGKFKWEVCINGINLQGKQCQGDTWGQWHKPKQMTATGQDAITLIQNGEILATEVGCTGESHFVVKYRGHFAPAQGKIFNCLVSNNARQFRCVSWTAGSSNW